MTRASSIGDTLLTVDWDYFTPLVPEDKPLGEALLEHDFGHQESLLFLKDMWKARYIHKDSLQTNGLERDFWGALPLAVRTDVQTSVSDSHAYVTDLIFNYDEPPIDQLVLVDAHHDVFCEADPNKFDCGNWLDLVLQNMPWVEVFWIQASWSKRVLSLPERYKGRVVEGEWPSNGSIRDIHICRSGCWTPPWLDHKFVEFVQEAPGSCALNNIVKPTEAWDAMAFRWTEQDLSEAVATARRIRKEKDAFRSGHPAMAS